MKFNIYIIFASISFVAIVMVVIFSKNLSSSLQKSQSISSPIPTSKYQTDISKISDSKAVTDTFNIFKTKNSFFSDDKNCFWTSEIISVKEFIPNSLIEISFGYFLIKKINEKCPYKIGDGYPSEGSFILAVKINNQWQLITEPEKMCWYVKNIPEANEFLTNTLQGYYGLCK